MSSFRSEFEYAQALVRFNLQLFIKKTLSFSTIHKLHVDLMIIRSTFQPPVGDHLMEPDGIENLTRFDNSHIDVLV